MSKKKRNRIRNANPNDIRVLLAKNLIASNSLKMENYYSSPGLSARRCADRLRNDLENDYAVRVIITARDAGKRTPVDYLRSVLESLCTRMEPAPVFVWDSKKIRETQAEAIAVRPGLLGSDQSRDSLFDPHENRIPRSSPCPAGNRSKTKFASPQEAQAAAEARSTAMGTGVVNTSYLCNACGWFHLTSQEMKPRMS